MSRYRDKEYYGVKDSPSVFFKGGGFIFVIRILMQLFRIITICVHLSHCLNAIDIEPLSFKLPVVILKSE